mmetsp:Transcript_13361/g.20727  ORF Transcript_13361/g.20727 Transcript_13361/m.20727 type:complete len:80 (-) Transcript_13361:526-765(-)
MHFQKYTMQISSSNILTTIFNASSSVHNVCEISKRGTSNILSWDSIPLSIEYQKLESHLAAEGELLIIGINLNYTRISG